MKKQPKLSDWINGDIKPTIKGWYERMYGSETETISKYFDYWDGKDWWYGVGNGKKSERAILQDRNWRGLAQDPAKVKE